MFQAKELEGLRLRREQLTLQSDAHRAQWMSDWQRLQSPESWLNDFLGLAGRRPLPIAVLATVTGLLAATVLRRSGRVAEGIGRLGKLIPLMLTFWRLFRIKRARPQSGPGATPDVSQANRP